MEVDGDFIGYTPIVEHALPSTVESSSVKVSKSGYKANTYSLKWKLRDQDLVSVESVTLKRKEPKRKPRRKVSKRSRVKRNKRVSRPRGKGILIVKSPVARIYIDGTFVRESPIIKEEVSAGFHTVKICLSRMPTNCQSKRVSVPANGRIKVRF